MVPLSALLHLWLSASTAFAEYNLILNRTLYPVDPLFVFDPQWATYIAIDTDTTSGRNPSFWRIILARPNDTVSYSPNEFLRDNTTDFWHSFEAAGAVWSVTTLDAGYNTSAISGDSDFRLKMVTPAGAMAGRSFLTEFNGNTVTATSVGDSSESDSDSYTGVDVPAGLHWQINNVTIVHNITMEE